MPQNGCASQKGFSLGSGNTLRVVSIPVPALFGLAQAHSHASATNTNGTLHRPTTRTKYTYDVDDRLLTAGGSTFTYDANGNQISKTFTSTGAPQVYTYDAANRLMAGTGGAVTNRFAYDGGGLLVRSSAQANPTGGASAAQRGAR